MKIKIKETTKENTIALSIAGIIIVSFYSVIHNLEPIRQFLSKLLVVLMPFILGFFLAFLMNALNQKIENQLFKNLKCSPKRKRLISVFVTLIITVMCLIGFVSIIVNQVMVSVQSFITTVNLDFDAASLNINNWFDSIYIDPVIIDWVIDMIQGTVLTTIDYLKNQIPSILSYSVYLASQVANFFIGLIVAVYILLDREKFYESTKKATIALFPKEVSAWLIRFCQISSKMFNSFIIGKMIDSLIIGILCYFGMLILKLDFAVLISFLVGVTNMIPFFGPFIGAVPGVIILLITDPADSLIFIIWIFALQQFDGNLLGPKILGDSMGLPTIWIMFAIMVGGGFFGIAGMFLGVPFFAVIYFLVKEYIDKQYEKKNNIIEE